MDDSHEFSHCIFPLFSAKVKRLSLEISQVCRRRGLNTLGISLMRACICVCSNWGKKKHERAGGGENLKRGVDEEFLSLQKGQSIIQVVDLRSSNIIQVTDAKGQRCSNSHKRNQNRIHSHTILRCKGNTVVFPVGLVHYQRNVGYGNSIAIAGVISIANSVFGSEPAIETIVSQIQSNF
ncbi:germin-like protein subfamily 1 member 11 [Capsicum annuum]|uniref:germin-like protein subfamily 1 member 11 n=1 Tax=Capsicum annuum TaxID=4072 RepID=UPI001FB15A45|nr:germin-like protein subfamily 1 member 11 [Capsicum annuum]